MAAATDRRDTCAGQESPLEEDVPRRGPKQSARSQAAVRASQTTREEAGVDE